MQQIQNTKINIYKPKLRKNLGFKNNDNNECVVVKQSNLESLKLPLGLAMIAGHATFIDKSAKQLKEDLKVLKNKTLGNGFNVLATIGTIIIACGLGKTISDYYNNKKQMLLKIKKEKNETDEKAVNKSLITSTIIQTSLVFVSNFLFGCFNIKNNRKTAFERSSYFALGAAALWTLVSVLSNCKTLNNLKKEQKFTNNKQDIMTK